MFHTMLEYISRASSSVLNFWKNSFQTSLVYTMLSDTLHVISVAKSLEDKSGTYNNNNGVVL